MKKSKSAVKGGMYGDSKYKWYYQRQYEAHLNTLEQIYASNKNLRKRDDEMNLNKRILNSCQVASKLAKNGKSKSLIS